MRSCRFDGAALAMTQDHDEPGTQFSHGELNTPFDDRTSPSGHVPRHPDDEEITHTLVEDELRRDA
jgi:hypothetical protein